MRSSRTAAAASEPSPPFFANAADNPGRSSPRPLLQQHLNHHRAVVVAPSLQFSRVIIPSVSPKAASFRPLLSPELFLSPILVLLLLDSDVHVTFLMPALGGVA